MSASLVKKSLALVDDTFEKEEEVKKGSIFDLIPEDKKLIKKIKQGGKKQKCNLLRTDKKLTVAEVKKLRKTKEERIKENLRKLKLIQKACAINLDDKLTTTIIKRAVTRRPVHKEEEEKKPETTAFTEEDFKKFEEEYFDDEF